MFARVPYTEIGGRHRPYLEIVFYNPLVNKSSNKTFAMVDSGADHTVIPYSVGSFIGLQPPSDSEKLQGVMGVGGGLNYIERKCRIHLTNKDKKKIYCFDETVWWIYPNKETMDEQNRLILEFKEFGDLKKQALPNTDLYNHFDSKMTETLGSLSKVLNRLETDVLLGRPFFNNFEFIQFFHKDRNIEGKCSFNYKVAAGKPLEIIEMAEADLLKQVKVPALIKNNH